MASAASDLELPPVSVLAVVRDEVVQALAAAEQLVAANRHDEAASRLADLWHELRVDDALALRQRLALAWSEMYRGDLRRAHELLAHADELVKAPRFGPADRAEIQFRRGCLAFQEKQVAEAITLLTRALETNESAPRPRPLLASNAYEWRARCYQTRRDWDAALRDVERALELAARSGDDLAEARALFQASLIAARRHDSLVARLYGEQALELFERAGNVLAVARILNNLGGIEFQLGETQLAEQRLAEAIEAASTAGSDPDLAQAVSSLALVYLKTGRPAEARARALRAAELLEGRRDFLDELGSTELTMSRSFLAEGDVDEAERWLDRADRTFNALGSTSHRAAALVARGDLARAGGDVDAAADLYRRAAEFLQDVQF
jgi:tetratricopeptide (TPR) repeat protein